MDDIKNKGRKLELSGKLLAMGKALLAEGKELEDTEIAHAGNQMVLLAGVLLHPEDMYMINYLCSMFVSKKMLDDMMNSPIGMMPPMNDNEIEDILKKMMDDHKKSGGEDNPS